MRIRLIVLSAVNILIIIVAVARILIVIIVIVVIVVMVHMTIGAKPVSIAVRMVSEWMVEWIVVKTWP